MAAPSASMDCTQRLADQLQSLTEVAETLTLRLLELEDRVASQEQQLMPLLGPEGHGDLEDLDATAQRLSETEQRLGRLESLLNGPQGSGDGRYLRAVPGSVQPPRPSLSDVSEEPLEKSLESSGLECEASLFDEAFMDAQESPGPALDQARHSAALGSQEEDFDLELQQA